MPRPSLVGAVSNRDFASYPAVGALCKRALLLERFPNHDCLYVRSCAIHCASYIQHLRSSQNPHNLREHLLTASSAPSVPSAIQTASVPSAIQTASVPSAIQTTHNPSTPQNLLLIHCPKPHKPLHTPPTTHYNTTIPKHKKGNTPCNHAKTTKKCKKLHQIHTKQKVYRTYSTYSTYSQKYFSN